MNTVRLPRNAALIVIDVQQGFDDLTYWGRERNNPDAEVEISRLLSAWRSSGRPVIHVHHASTNPGSPLRADHPGHAVKPEAAPMPGEPVLVKNVNSAFIGTDLEQRLREAGVETVVIVGLTTDHCVSTTVRMAANLGFETLLVSDATATFDKPDSGGASYPADLVHKLSLATLRSEFATIVDTQELLNAAET